MPRLRAKSAVVLLWAVFSVLTAIAALADTVQWDGMKQVGQMRLDYARGFSVRYYDGGYTLITIGEDDCVLVIPEGKEAPEGLQGKAVIVRQPLGSLYMAASSAMDFMRSLNVLPRVAMTSTRAKDWTIPEIAELVEQDEILYIGKYSAPDFEALVELECDLAVESTMIWHAPEIKEQIERLGIPVIVERSSYEHDPRGRLEWIRLYGCLLGCDSEAEAIYRESLRSIEQIQQEGDTRPTVAVFYLNAGGGIVAYKPGDYAARMVELAGAAYALKGKAADTGGTTMRMGMEDFYLQAGAADILIYTATIADTVQNRRALIERAPMLEQFTAFQTGNVWCMQGNLFQQPTQAAKMIMAMHHVFTDGSGTSENILFKLAD